MKNYRPVTTHLIGYNVKVFFTTSWNVIFVKPFISSSHRNVYVATGCMDITYTHEYIYIHYVKWEQKKVISNNYYICVLQEARLGNIVAIKCINSYAQSKNQKYLVLTAHSLLQQHNVHQ